MSDSQQPVPSTPGYHPAPGTPPAHRPVSGVPATPGYHANKNTAGEGTKWASVSQAETKVASSGADNASSGQASTAPSDIPPSPIAEKDGDNQKAPGVQTKATSARPGLGNLVSKLSDQVQALVKGEIELVKVKVSNMLKRSGVGIALLVVAGVLALYMLGFLFGAAVDALALIVPIWAAKLIVAGILLVLVAIFALVGKASLKKGLSDKPDPQAGIKEGIAAVKKGLE